MVGLIQKIKSLENFWAYRKYFILIKLRNVKVSFLNNMLCVASGDTYKYDQRRVASL